jgi:hypothetical protein
VISQASSFAGQVDTKKEGKNAPGAEAIEFNKNEWVGIRDSESVWPICTDFFRS